MRQERVTLADHSSHSLTAASIVRLTTLTEFGKNPADYSKTIPSPLVALT